MSSGRSSRNKLTGPQPPYVDWSSSESSSADDSDSEYVPSYYCSNTDGSNSCTDEADVSASEEMFAAKVRHTEEVIQ
jgi:hypothetical protein